MAAALLGAAVATTMLLTNEPLGLSLTPRMENMMIVRISTQIVRTTPTHRWIDAIIPFRIRRAFPPTAAAASRRRVRYRFAWR